MYLFIYLFIYFSVCLSVCLFVCLFGHGVKTAGQNFFKFGMVIEDGPEHVFSYLVFDLVAGQPVNRPFTINRVTLLKVNLAYISKTVANIEKRRPYPPKSSSRSTTFV